MAVGHQLGVVPTRGGGGTVVAVGRWVRPRVKSSRIEDRDEKKMGKEIR